MSEKVKLIIEITKEHYEATKKLDKKYPYMLAGGETAIAHGTPLDDVKAEIANLDRHKDKYSCVFNRPDLIDLVVVDVLQILDNIGKAESEVKPNE